MDMADVDLRNFIWKCLVIALLQCVVSNIKGFKKGIVGIYTTHALSPKG
jgi:hypothetical protein